MKTVEKQERILVKPWEAAIDRRAFARTSMALAPNGTYMIEAKMGEIFDPNTQEPIKEADLAAGIAEYIVETGLQDASMELAADELRKVTDDIPADKRHFLAESEIVFSQASSLILQEAEQDRRILAKVPALT